MNLNQKILTKSSVHFFAIICFLFYTENGLNPAKFLVVYGMLTRCASSNTDKFSKSFSEFWKCRYSYAQNKLPKSLFSWSEMAFLKTISCKFFWSMYFWGRDIWVQISYVSVKFCYGTNAQEHFSYFFIAFLKKVWKKKKCWTISLSLIWPKIVWP